MSSRPKRVITVYLDDRTIDRLDWLREEFQKEGVIPEKIGRRVSRGDVIAFLVDYAVKNPFWRRRHAIQY